LLDCLAEGIDLIVDQRREASVRYSLLQDPSLLEFQRRFGVTQIPSGNRRALAL
jgi:phosphoenolpyruvate synthase/pyruvate phosphate dikinase